MRDRFLRPTFTSLVSVTILLVLLGLSLSSSIIEAAELSPVLLDVGVDIIVTSNNFTPNSFTITTGEDVTWHNNQGFHNIVADDGSFTSGDPASAAWVYSNTFNTPGTYQYFCEIHGGPGGSGMSGVIIVQEGPTATPVPTDTPAAPTNTPTNTPIPATNTPTNTPIPATNTPTNTPVDATNTPTSTAATATNTPTSTAVAATPTVTPTEPATALTYTNISVSRNSGLPTLAFLLLGSVLVVVFRMRRR